MTPRWYFNQPKPGDKNREPVLGQFFATDAITNPAEALVREGIQNSLDAGSHSLVRISIYASGQEGALSAPAPLMRATTSFVLRETATSNRFAL